MPKLPALVRPEATERLLFPIRSLLLLPIVFSLLYSPLFDFRRHLSGSHYDPSLAVKISKRIKSVLCRHSGRKLRCKSRALSLPGMLT